MSGEYTILATIDGPALEVGVDALGSDPIVQFPREATCAEFGEKPPGTAVLPQRQYVFVLGCYDVCKANDRGSHASRRIDQATAEAQGYDAEATS